MKNLDIKLNIDKNQLPPCSYILADLDNEDYNLQINYAIMGDKIAILTRNKLVGLGQSTFDLSDFKEMIEFFHTLLNKEE